MQNPSQQQQDGNYAIGIIAALAILGQTMPLRSIRTYLTRPDLPGHPRASSAWTHMREIGNNWAFITVMGIDVRTFEAILVPFSSAWDSSTISQLDVNPNGEPQPHQCSLDSAGGLALVLHWISSTMAAYTLQQIFAITAAVCTRDLQFGRTCLLQVLRDLKLSRITWPLHEERCLHYSQLIECKFPLLTKCFGFINGLNVPVNVAENEEYVLPEL